MKPRLLNVESTCDSYLASKARGSEEKFSGSKRHPGQSDRRESRFEQRHLGLRRKERLHKAEIW